MFPPLDHELFESKERVCAILHCIYNNQKLWTQKLVTVNHSEWEDEWELGEVIQALCRENKKLGTRILSVVPSEVQARGEGSVWVIRPQPTTRITGLVRLFLLLEISCPLPYFSQIQVIPPKQQVFPEMRVHRLLGKRNEDRSSKTRGQCWHPGRQLFSLTSMPFVRKCEMQV